MENFYQITQLVINFVLWPQKPFTLMTICIKFASKSSEKGGDTKKHTHAYVWGGKHNLWYATVKAHNNSLSISRAFFAMLHCNSIKCLWVSCVWEENSEITVGSSVVIRASTKTENKKWAISLLFYIHDDAQLEHFTINKFG
jgi:hypothetical protein